jgi:hypothetical protein
MRTSLGFRSVDMVPRSYRTAPLLIASPGVLKDAVNHSITLCHQLEAGSAPKPIIGRLPSEAIARLEAATAAFVAEYLPKLEREVPKLEREPDRRGREAKLLRELVIHHFETAARECMVLCVSVAEFEAELRASIARFVQFRVGQYRWLGDAMRNELDAGFTFFFGTTRRYVHPSMDTGRSAMEKAREVQGGHKSGHNAENTVSEGESTESRKPKSGEDLGWYARVDSNHRPFAPEANALSI